MTPQSIVGDLLASTFNQARAATPGLGERWLAASGRASSLLSRSLIAVTVQRLGEIDAVCRCVERELIERPPAPDVLDMRFHYYVMMAGLWVGAAHSVCFILNQRKLITDEPFKRLAEDLKLVRVQLEKYEVPLDRNLDGPIEMTTGSGPDDAPPSISTYDYNDVHRSHIGRYGLSARNSLMWEVLEVQPIRHRWIERTDLSDRFLQIFTERPRHSTPIVE
jgi:hypothetical protein